MKKNLLVVFFLLSVALIFGQTTDRNRDHKTEHQIGLDASAFVTRFLSVNSQTIESNSGLIFLYRRGKDGKNFRLSAAPVIDLEKRTSNDAWSSFLSLQVKIGKEYYRDFGKRWRAYAGWETGIFGMNFHNKSSSNSSVFRGLRLSAGPIVGIQFRLNSRMSLSTEAIYDLWLRYSFQKNSNGSIREVYTVETIFSPLSFITVNYHFW